MSAQENQTPDNEKTPIILAASGTATAAADTYQRIEARCRQAFTGHPIHWAYSSRAEDASGWMIVSPSSSTSSSSLSRRILFGWPRRMG